MHPYVNILQVYMSALGQSDYATVKSLFVMDPFTFEPARHQVTHLGLIYDTHPIRASAGNKYEL